MVDCLIGLFLNSCICQSTLPRLLLYIYIASGSYMPLLVVSRRTNLSTSVVAVGIPVGTAADMFILCHIALPLNTCSISMVYTFDLS